MKLAAGGLQMTASVEKIGANTRHRKIQFAACRNLYAVRILAHKYRIDHSSYIQRFVHESFSVSFFIMIMVEILARKRYQRGAVFLKNLKFIANGIGLQHKTVVTACFHALLDDAPFIGPFLHKFHKNLEDIRIIAVHSKILRVGYQPRKQTCSGVAVEVAVKSACGDNTENKLAGRRHLRIGELNYRLHVGTLVMVDEYFRSFSILDERCEMVLPRRRIEIAADYQVTLLHESRAVRIMPCVNGNLVEIGKKPQ